MTKKYQPVYKFFAADGRLNWLCSWFLNTFEIFDFSTLKKKHIFGCPIDEK